MNNIVERIELLRKQKGLTKKALADSIGMPQSSMNKWYYSNVTPSVANIENVCNALGITVEQFFIGFGEDKLLNEQNNFLQEWRLLSATEKDAIAQVMLAFKELRMGDVK